MKKVFYKAIAAVLALAVLTAALAACAEKTPATESSPSPSADVSPSPSAAPSPSPGVSPDSAGNFSDEMKIPYRTDLSQYDGSDSYEREGDHPGSPYFSNLDFYNLKSTDSLTILEGFKTQQQTSEWSCGVSAALMVLEWFGKLGDNDEASLAVFRQPSEISDWFPGGLIPSATTLRQLIQIFDGIGGFTYESAFDYPDDAYEVFTLEYVQETLNAGYPILIGWNDWGGHWQVIIGYDTMGTDDYEGDDVIIVADPYDTTDHNQDGYGVYGAERFIYNFSFYTFPEEEINDYAFLVVKN